MKSCFIVPVFKSELTWEENLKNGELALEELKNLNVPVKEGKVGTGGKSERETVMIIPDTHDHIKDSLVKVYNQSSYLKCDEKAMCSVVSVMSDGSELSSQLGTLQLERFAGNSYTIQVGMTHYSIEGIV